MEKLHKQTSILHVLSIAAFRNLWVAQLISQLTVNMLTFVLGIFIYQQTKSNTAVSILYLTFGLPATVFGLISGVYVDRFDKKNILFTTTVIRAALVLVMFYFRTNLTALYLLTALIAIFSQFFVPAEASLIPHVVSPQLLLTANSLFTLTFYSAIIGGFVAGGPILALVGSKNVLLLISFLFAFAAVLVLLIPKIAVRTVMSRPENGLRQLRTDITDCFVFIRNHVRIGQAILLMTISQAVIAIFATLGPGFADTILHIQLTDASIIILGPAALGMIIGALFMGNYGMLFKKISLIKAGFYASGILFLGVSLLITLNDWDTMNLFFYAVIGKGMSFVVLMLSIAAFFFLGFANSLIDVACNTVLQEKSTDEMRGKVYGLLASLVGGVAVIPVVISAVIADTFGISKIMISLGILLLLVGLVIRRKQGVPA